MALLSNETDSPYSWLLRSIHAARVRTRTIVRDSQTGAGAATYARLPSRLIWTVCQGRANIGPSRLAAFAESGNSVLVRLGLTPITCKPIIPT